MIDPNNITNYNINKYQAEEFVLFTILVGGKTAKTIAKSLNHILKESHDKLGLEDFRPFTSLAPYTKDELQDLLKRHGVGCHSLKSQAIYDLIRRNFDLHTVSASDLERVFGIGPKTARYFILHTRKDARVACLDRHILSFLSDFGYVVPKSTPGSKKQYAKIEKLFITLAEKAKITISGLDLDCWNAYSKKDKCAIETLLNKFHPIKS